jgi:hypothetical protein
VERRPADDAARLASRQGAVRRAQDLARRVEAAARAREDDEQAADRARNDAGPDEPEAD